MKEYLLLFWNETGDGRYQIDPEQMKKGMEAWQAWIGQIAQKGNLISTKPIRYEGVLVSPSYVSEQPCILEKKMVTGYLICKAGSKDEVVEWAKTCPIGMSPAGFTEIREIAPFEL